MNEFEPENQFAADLNQFIAIETVGDHMISGKIYEPLAQNVQAIRNYFEEKGYAAIFEKQGGHHLIRFGLAMEQTTKKSKPIINIILLVATVFTTLLVGSINRGGNPFVHILDLIKGIPFSFSIIVILGSHELGHYLMARRQGVDATLPYFLPIPHPLVGTMGAFIRIKSIIPNRNALIKVGVAGPLVGFLVALPVTIVGLKFSTLQAVSGNKGGIALGSSLLFHFLSKLFFSNVPNGYDVMLHPVAFAGWLGFFVTALNLIPVGQLDGGHIAYAVLGKFQRIIMIVVVAVMVLLGLRWPGWYFWAVLTLLLGLRHPKPQDEITPLGTNEKILALVALIILILTFMPVPIPLANIK
jgi:membrane-associated protease RseP (regulator of RpoE activity)